MKATGACSSLCPSPNELWGTTAQLERAQKLSLLVDAEWKQRYAEGKARVLQLTREILAHQRAIAEQDPSPVSAAFAGVFASACQDFICWSCCARLGIKRGAVGALVCQTLGQIVH